MATATDTTSQTTTDTKPATESELAKRIDASGILTRPEPTQTAKTGQQEPAKQRTNVPDDEIEDTTQTDDDGTDAAGDDEQTTDEAPPTDDGEGAEDETEVQALKRELAEIKDLLKQGKRKDAIATDDPEGAAAPKGESDKSQKDAKDRIATVKAKIKAARGEWGELIDALGLEELVDDLDGERKGRAQEAQEAQQRQMVAAADQIHKAINNISRADPELTKVLGIGRHETLKPNFLKTRSRIFAAATRALEDSMEEVQSKQRKAPITEGEALAIGIKRVTGKDVGTPGQSAADKQAKERARMARPASGGSTSREDDREETPAKTEKRLASSIDAFFRQGN